MALLNAEELALLKEVEKKFDVRLSESMASRLIDSLRARYASYTRRNFKGARTEALRALRIAPALWSAYASFAGKIFGKHAGRKAKARAAQGETASVPPKKAEGLFFKNPGKPSVKIIIKKNGQLSF